MRVLNQIETGFCVIGEVTFENAVSIRRDGEKIIHHFSQQNKRCVIDLKNMKEQNAVCLAVMLSWMRTAKRCQVSLSFIRTPPPLSHMIQAFGLTALMESYHG